MFHGHFGQKHICHSDISILPRFNHIALIQIFQRESNGPCYLEQRLLGGWLEIENRGFKNCRCLWIFHDLPWKNHVQWVFLPMILLDAERLSTTKPGRGPLVKRLWICLICDMEVGNHRKPRFFTHWRTLSGHVRDIAGFSQQEIWTYTGITQLDAIICRILQRDRFKIFPECCDMEASRFSCLQLFHRIYLHRN